VRARERFGCKTATEEDLDRLKAVMAEIDALDRGREAEPNDNDADSDRSRSWLCWAGQYEWGQGKPATNRDWKPTTQLI
jgi:hypothetical protein